MSNATLEKSMRFDDVRLMHHKLGFSTRGINCICDLTRYTCCAEPSRALRRRCLRRQISETLISLSRFSQTKIVCFAKTCSLKIKLCILQGTLCEIVILYCVGCWCWLKLSKITPYFYKSLSRENVASRLWIEIPITNYGNITLVLFSAFNKIAKGLDCFICHFNSNINK